MCRFLLVSGVGGASALSNGWRAEKAIGSETEREMGGEAKLPWGMGIHQFDLSDLGQVLTQTLLCKFCGWEYKGQGTSRQEGNIQKGSSNRCLTPQYWGGELEVEVGVGLHLWDPQTHERMWSHVTTLTAWRQCSEPAWKQERVWCQSGRRNRSP